MDDANVIREEFVDFILCDSGTRIAAKILEALGGLWP